MIYVIICWLVLCIIPPHSAYVYRPCTSSTSVFLHLGTKPWHGGHLILALAVWLDVGKSMVHCSLGWRNMEWTFCAEQLCVLICDWDLVANCSTRICRCFCYVISLVPHNYCISFTSIYYVESTSHWQPYKCPTWHGPCSQCMSIYAYPWLAKTGWPWLHLAVEQLQTRCASRATIWDIGAAKL